jgi:hypothetical protein
MSKYDDSDYDPREALTDNEYSDDDDDDIPSIDEKGNLITKRPRNLYDNRDTKRMKNSEYTPSSNTFAVSNYTSSSSAAQVPSQPSANNVSTSYLLSFNGNTDLNNSLSSQLMINTSHGNTSSKNAQNTDTEANITTMIDKQKDGHSIPNQESKLQEQKWAQALKNARISASHEAAQAARIAALEAAPSRSSNRIRNRPKDFVIPDTPVIYHKDIHQEWLPCLKKHASAYFSEIPENAWTEEMLDQVAKKMCKVVKYSPENMKMVEEQRVPMVMTGVLAPPAAWKNKNDLLNAQGVDKNMKCKSFRGVTVTPYLLKDKADPKTEPVSVVESMCPEMDDWDTEYAKFTKKMTEDWNGLLLTRAGRGMTGYSIILSQEDAWSKAHKHPLLFFNYAFHGLKSYILYDTTNPPNRFNKLQMATRQLKWHEFIADPTAYFAYIDGNTPQNFIACPTWYSHDVYTCGGNGLYVGMGGFGLNKNLLDANKILSEASDPYLMAELRYDRRLTEGAAKAWTTTTKYMDP